ncbi:HalOD1 output domain-containing protein [Natrialbaceae archaeon GCM10025810]|uniref:HalOD1 output domain-containing protein n=1 Tax=Halovalidus salilacus TaxID=3075124 RepID=UPI0036235358
MRYERNDDEPPSVAVAAALAEYHNEDVLGGSFVLYEHVDPEALDALFADTYDGRSRASGEVRFDVQGATVSVDDDRVTVESTGYATR